MTRTPALALLALACPALLAQEPLAVSRFASEGLAGWEQESFSGETSYKVVSEDGQAVLRARSDDSASGLYREVQVDLRRTPWLSWRWKVGHPLDVAEERTKAGDDFAARVYVVVRYGWAFWQTRALNYVWASRLAEGTTWPNPYTGKAHMVAVQSGGDRAGQWVTESHNVLEDYTRAFGEPPQGDVAVAVMTDTDQTGQSVTAWYADLRFTAQPAD